MIVIMRTYSSTIINCPIPMNDKSKSVSSNEYIFSVNKTRLDMTQSQVNTLRQNVQLAEITQASIQLYTSGITSIHHSVP